MKRHEDGTCNNGSTLREGPGDGNYNEHGRFEMLTTGVTIAIAVMVDL